MSDNFQKIADYVMGYDDSELGLIKAERDYALHCLERETAICAEAQRRLDYMKEKYGKIDWDAAGVVGDPQQPVQRSREGGE
jgi:hypothetical protein